MNKIMICDSCGYEKILGDTDMPDTQCPICSSRKIRVELSDKEDEEIIGQLENNEEQKMINDIVESIGQIGNNKTWDTIERISDFKLRIKLRVLFLKLGGRIPNREQETKEKEK